jgi:hypothetical protein
MNIEEVSRDLAPVSFTALLAPVVILVNSFHDVIKKVFSKPLFIYGN